MHHIQLVLIAVTILQFRALSDQLYQSPDHHEFVREQIINQVNIGIKISHCDPQPYVYSSIFSLIRLPLQLKSNRDAYDGYVLMSYDEYLDKVSRFVPHRSLHL
jgi:hypothetical protein